MKSQCLAGPGRTAAQHALLHGELRSMSSLTHGVKAAAHGGGVKGRAAPKVDGAARRGAGERRAHVLQHSTAGTAQHWTYVLQFWHELGLCSTKQHNQAQRRPCPGAVPPKNKTPTSQSIPLQALLPHKPAAQPAHLAAALHGQHSAVHIGSRGGRHAQPRRRQARASRLQARPPQRVLQHRGQVRWVRPGAAATFTTSS